MATQTIDSTRQVTTKSGKGMSHGVVSELITFFGIQPGHADEVHAAAQRYCQRLRDMGPEAIQKSGLREARFVIIDGGQRLLFITAFETDWDPYIDDAAAIVGPEYFVDWMQHTVEADALSSTVQRVVGDGSHATVDTARLKQILQSVQVRASGYFDSLSGQTMPEISKAVRVERAF